MILKRTMLLVMIALTQPENHAVLRAVREWHPQVFVDHHGQVASYFFPPAAEPINKNLALEKSKFWYDKFGRANAAAFDRYGWNYYVRYVFDVYYAGYMDSWSSLQGATGMIYETDGGGHVILFAEDPNFRFLWRTTTQFFLNSILLAPSLR